LIDTIYASSQVFTVDYSKTIEAKEHQSMFITFTPGEEGLWNETLSIISNDTNNTPSIVELHGVGVTDIHSMEAQMPNEYSLLQNYPNPFNPSTTIEFTLPKSEFVELKVYNILGKEVSTVISKKLNPGNHNYPFDGTNLASGIYYYQLVAGDFREVKKMVLLR